jgi:hypothetical protein
MDDPNWGWRQRLSWKLGYRRGQSGRPYSCPWWADEQVFALAFMQGNGGEIPRDPGIRTRGRGPEIRASAAAVLFRALRRSFFGTRKTK